MHLLAMLILLHPDHGSATVSPEQWCAEPGSGWSRQEALAAGWTLAPDQVDPAEPKPAPEPTDTDALQAELAEARATAEAARAELDRHRQSLAALAPLPPRLSLAHAILAASDDDLIALPGIAAKNFDRLRDWATEYVLATAAPAING